MLASLLYMLTLNKRVPQDYGLQQRGMTRNQSPVYLVYPSDPSGRRASEAVQLQYASPSEQQATLVQNRTNRHTGNVCILQIISINQAH